MRAAAAQRRRASRSRVVGRAHAGLDEEGCCARAAGRVSAPLRGGFTILEVMIVLALLVALAAVMLPQFFSRLGAASADAACAQVEAAVVGARAMAAREGKAVQLVARLSGGGGAGSEWVLMAEEFRPEGAEGETAARARLMSELPEGVVVSDAPALKVEGAGAGSPGEGEPVGVASRAARDAVVLAVFMPDGSAASDALTYLVLGDRSVEVKINRWTGAAAFRALSAAAPPEGSTPPEDEPEAEPPEGGAGL